MTFSDWYAANVKPQLEESLARLPAQAREPLRTASRQAMAACWNAALQTVCNQKFTREEFPIAFRLPAEILDQITRLGA